MGGHFSDLVTEAEQVFNVLGVGVLAGSGQVDWQLDWEGADHGGISCSKYCSKYCFNIQYYTNIITIKQCDK